MAEEGYKLCAVPALSLKRYPFEFIDDDTVQVEIGSA
jgi:hypothetical protein